MAALVAPCLQATVAWKTKNLKFPNWPKKMGSVAMNLNLSLIQLPQLDGDPDGTVASSAAQEHASAGQQQDPRHPKRPLRPHETEPCEHAGGQAGRQSRT
eukprot:14096639-Alexandrium_andersonii.AAC.1